MPEFTLSLMRPWWLLGFIPLLCIGLFMLRSSRQASGWEQVVDPVLHDYVIEPGQDNKSGLRWLLLIGWMLCLSALCGPVWTKQDMPVYQGQQAQVVLFDLSRSMYTDDIKPSRVTRARFKLSDLLASAKGLQIALIAFAERPYVVSPLSDDANTIAAFVESLDPAIMPAQGSRLDLAIEQSLDLLAQAAVQHGHIVVITDSDVSARSIDAARLANQSGHRLSIIGVGTEKGAPLRAENGRFLQDSNGAVVVPQLKPTALAGLAEVGGGVFTLLDTGSKDIERVSAVQDQIAVTGDLEDSQDSQEYWVEYAPYAVVLLVLLSLLLFRRGLFL